MDFEGRGASRIQSENLLAYRLFDEVNNVLNEGMVKTLDISRSGIAIQSQVPMEVGLKIEITIGMGNDTVKTIGRVQNQKKIDGHNYQIGIEFDFLSDDDLNKIGMRYPSILR